jgi:hypothetical protein
LRGNVQIKRPSLAWNGGGEGLEDGGGGIGDWGVRSGGEEGRREKIEHIKPKISTVTLQLLNREGIETISAGAILVQILVSVIMSFLQVGE